MSTYRRRSVVNENQFERIERLAISNPRLRRSVEGIHHQRDDMLRDKSQGNFRMRSNTVPASLPSKELKGVRTRINKRINKYQQTDVYSDYEKKQSETQIGPKKYLKPIVKQNKIPADALEDPLASSGRPETRKSERSSNISVERQKQSDKGNSVISGMDILDYSERHTMSSFSKRQTKRLSVDHGEKLQSISAGRRNSDDHSVERQNHHSDEEEASLQGETFRPRARTMSPDILRKVRFMRSNSEVELLDEGTANRLHQSCDRLPALRTGTDQPLHSILKKPQERARRIAWTEPLPDIPPIPTVTVSFYDGEKEAANTGENEPVKRERSKSMFEWETPKPKDVTFYDGGEFFTSRRTCQETSSLPRGSDALNAVLRQLQDNDLKPEVRRTDSDKMIGLNDQLLNSGSIMA